MTQPGAGKTITSGESTVKAIDLKFPNFHAENSDLLKILSSP
jgi:hypothetical protein